MFNPVRLRRSWNALKPGPPDPKGPDDLEIAKAVLHLGTVALGGLAAAGGALAWILSN